MKLSHKYNTLETVIQSELSKSKPDYERLFYIRSVQNQILKSSLSPVHFEQPKTVFYFQCSSIEKQSKNVSIVSYLRIKASGDAFSSCSNLSIIVPSKFGENSLMRTAKEVVRFWGNGYLIIRFIDVEIERKQTSPKTLFRRA